MASIFDKLFGNPRKIDKLPTTSQLDKQAGGFTTPPAGFKFGAPQSPRFMPSFGGTGSMNTYGGLGGGLRKQTGALRDDNDKDGFGKKLKDLFSGESGAALGGVAQGAGAVLGAYMNRQANKEMSKLEREKFEEERRREGLREQERERIRALLSPVLDAYRPR